MDPQESSHPDTAPQAPPGPDPDPGFYERALNRIPRWIVAATLLGLPFAWYHVGPRWSASYLIGAVAGYWNFVLIRRVTGRIVESAKAQAPVLRTIIRLTFLATAAYLVIRFTQVNLAALFTGFFVPVAAIAAEIIYELTSYRGG